MRSLIQRNLPLLCLATQWDLLPWLWRRGAENQDAALLHGILALAVAGWWTASRGKSHVDPQAQIAALCGLMFTAGLSAMGVYPLVRMLSLCLTLAGMMLMQLPRAETHRVALGTACLLLPFSEETSAFFLGYPARLLATHLAGFFLRFAGFQIQIEGAILQVNSSPLFADAPCSGLMMGWTGFAIASLLALYHGLNGKRSLLLFVSTGLLILLGNSFRMMLLAQLEQLLPGTSNSPLLHNSIGIFSFIILLPALWALARKRPLPDPSGKSGGFFCIWPLLLLIAAGMPLLQAAKDSSPAPMSSTPPIWPEVWEGESLSPLPPTELDQIFARNFPGSIARFQSGNKTLLFRHLQRPSRGLHSGMQCYRANGFTVTPQPAWRDSDGNLWSCYLAEKGQEKLHIREQIRSLNSPATWPDVSAWYWAAQSGRDSGPWLAVTVAEDQQSP